jgi:hypothetical protein
VEDAGAGDLLVQRIFRDPGHCGFNSAEWVAGLEALVEWVEDGERPDGHDVHQPDYGLGDRSFELRPRVGTPEGDDVPGADQRVHVRGRAFLDGRPLERARFLGVDVFRDGLQAACGVVLSSVEDGRFEIEVRSEAETTGCGAPGAGLRPWVFVDGVLLRAHGLADWPGAGEDLTMDNLHFDTTDPVGHRGPAAEFAGEVWTADGEVVPPGTTVEARIGEAVCGVTSTSRTGSFSGYTLNISRPSVRGCRSGATITFWVDGVRADQTVANESASSGGLDLTLSR